MRAAFLANHRKAALGQWRGLVEVTRLLFREPNPAAVKVWLCRAGLIASPESRQAMLAASLVSRATLDPLIDARQPGAAPVSDQRRGDYPAG